MAARANDLREAMVGAEEEAFNRNLLWRTLTNTEYEGTAQGNDEVRIIRPVTSGLSDITTTSGGNNTNADTTRNPSVPTASEVTTLGERLLIRQRSVQSFIVGIDDTNDLSVDLVAAAGAAVGRQFAEVIDGYLQGRFIAGITAGNTTAIGDGTNYVETTASSANFGSVAGTAADADLIYDALMLAQLKLENEHIVHTGEVQYQPFAVMHPAMWNTVRRRELDKTVFTSRDELIESGADVNRSKIAGRLFSFDIYLDTTLAETTGASGSPNTMPILYGHPLAVTFAQTMEVAHLYPPGTVPGSFGYKANFYRRYGALKSWAALAKQLVVATSVNQ